MTSRCGVDPASTTPEGVVVPSSVTEVVAAGVSPRPDVLDDCPALVPAGRGVAVAPVSG